MREWNDEMKVGVDWFEMQGGEYRKTPYRLPTKQWCDFVKNDKMLMPEVYAVTDFPKTCPFPAVIIFIITNIFF